MITKFKIYGESRKKIGEFEGPLKTREEYIPRQMYRFIDYPVCFIGFDEENEDFPVICYLLTEDYNGLYHFINWNFVAQITPLNISFKEYIIKNDIVGKALGDMKTPKWSSGGSEYGRKLIKEFREELLKDPEIKIWIETKKYNL